MPVLTNFPTTRLLPTYALPLLPFPITTPDNKISYSTPNRLFPFTPIIPLPVAAFFPSIAFPRLGEKVNKHTFSLTTNYLPSLAAEGNAFVGEVEDDEEEEEEEEEEDQEGKEG